MSYDFDLFVIGAGSGGIRAARYAKGFGARVAVAESRYLGGCCVNVGCVPKKILVDGSHLADEFEQASSLGWTADKPHFDWGSLIGNKNREIGKIKEFYRQILLKHQISLLEGHARLLGPHQVEVNDQSFTAEHILIATGSWPKVPDIAGREYAITSNDVFFLDKLPSRVLVVGGGYIAVEFAGIFCSLGCDTRLLYRGELFLRKFDQSVRTHVYDELRKRGLAMEFKADVVRIEKQVDGTLIVSLLDGRRLETDSVLYATGRRPLLDGLGLENTQVEIDDNGFIKVDENFETREPSILALGDVIGGVQLTPVAIAEGTAVARRLFKPEQYRPVDYNCIPTAVYSQPAIGAVGLTEEESIDLGHEVVVFESRFQSMKAKLAGSSEQSFAKIIVDGQTDKILGCHMVGPDAAEIIQGFAIALKAGATKRLFDSTMGVHPTIAEEFVSFRKRVSR